MAHKRTHVRVPFKAKATLSNSDGEQTKARTIDISPGGLGIVNPSIPLGHNEYRIEVTTAEGLKINLKAKLIRKGRQSAGFKTSEIDKKSMQIIADLVAEFQTTEAFVKQIDRHDLLEQLFVDDDGSEYAVTFEMES